MTYASKQLADELKKLSSTEGPEEYCNCQLPENLPSENLNIPDAVTEFVREAAAYTQLTEKVSEGVY